MTRPDTAIMLAAGLGKRMRPITVTMPKPLVKVSGKPLIDWGLDALAGAGVENTIVNVHYLADQLIDYLGSRSKPKITISDERDLLLDSAGGIVNVLPQLGVSRSTYSMLIHSGLVMRRSRIFRRWRMSGTMPGWIFFS